MAGEIIGVLTRVGAIVVALFIIASSIATVKVINNNESLVRLRDYDGEIELSREGKKLQDLIILTQGAAYWAFVVCGITVFAGALSIVLLFVNRQPTGKLIIGIIEMILMCLGMLCFLSLGIACAVYADSWGEPPSPCEEADKLLEKDDICDSVPLTATNALQAVLSFLQIGVFGAVFLVTIFSLRSRPVATTTSYSVMTYQEKI